MVVYDVLNSNMSGGDSPLRRSGDDLNIMDEQFEISNLKETVKKYESTICSLRNEAQSNALSKAGVKTLEMLLRETNIERDRERKKARCFKAAVVELQKRLIDHKIDSDVTIENMPIPGPTTQLLDNLVKENARLQQDISRLREDPNEVAELKQAYSEARNECDRLEMAVDSLAKEKGHLELLFSSSNDERVAEIMRLRKIKDILLRKTQTNDVSAQSLNDEVRELRERLSTVGAQCSTVLGKIETVSRIPTEGVVQQQQQPQPPPQDVLAQIERLQSENGALKEENEKVKKMNARWQEYKEERDKYTRTLEFDINEQRRLKNELEKRTASQYDQLLAEKLQIEGDLADTKKQLSDRSKEMRLLQNKLKSAQAYPNAASHSAHSEEINAYKQQIKTCTEDFMSERKEKEQALRKVQLMEEDLRERERRPLFTPYQEFQMRNFQDGNRAGDNRGLAGRNYHSMISGYDEPDFPQMLQIDAAAQPTQTHVDGEPLTKCIKCGGFFPPERIKTHTANCAHSLLGLD